jgi:hypothetical protein
MRSGTRPAETSSYRERFRLPSWLILDAERRVIGSCKAETAEEVREAFRRAAREEDPDGPRYFSRVVEAARYVRRG